MYIDGKWSFKKRVEVLENSVEPFLNFYKNG